MKKQDKGFTLIELLVVVLIIGVLAAIALPMYQKAVMRSRFNALMPIAKAMADANEAYYLEHNSYASNPQNLPVEGKTAYPTGTKLSFGNDMDYAYVLASNPSVKNNYVVYQKHSINYPGEIHCEALEEDAQAEYICESAGGTQNIGVTLTEGYTTYILSGDGTGFPLALLHLPTCDTAGTAGLSCRVSKNEQGQAVKQMCINGVCRTQTYNEDGSYTSTTCKSDGSNGEGVCTSDLAFSTYDANGRLISQRKCSSIDSSGNCTAYRNQLYDNYDWTYDENGNKLTYRHCANVDSEGNCTQYYNDSSDYVYDANGNLLMERYCSSVDINTKNCTQYRYGSYRIYDENGNMLRKRRCNNFDSSGNCTDPNSGVVIHYTYDENGNQLSQRQCSGVDEDWNCTKYFMGTDWIYDENGNIVSERQCNSFTSSFNSSGKCIDYYKNTEFAYDDAGKQISSQFCAGGSSINTTTGECKSYGSATVYNN